MFTSSCLEMEMDGIATQSLVSKETTFTHHPSDCYFIQRYFKTYPSRTRAIDCVSYSSIHAYYCIAHGVDTIIVLFSKCYFGTKRVNTV